MRQHDAAVTKIIEVEIVDADRNGRGDFQFGGAVEHRIADRQTGAQQAVRTGQRVQKLCAIGICNGLQNTSPRILAATAPDNASGKFL